MKCFSLKPDRQILFDQLAKESRMAFDSSKTVLEEFESLDDED